MTENETEKLLEFVAQKLVSLGEVSRPYTIVPHTHQGHNSRVYILSSQGKEFIIHLAKPFEHYFSDKTWERLLMISKFLSQTTELPVARILFTELTHGLIVSAQEKLPGDIAGTVAIVNHSVVYTWLQDKSVLMPQIQRMLAEIHSISVSGYGLPVEENKKLTGMCVTWQEFLLQRIALWLGALQSEKCLRKLEKGLYTEIKTYAEQFYTGVSVTEGSLIHGDLGNPSNILAENGEITGIIDWEFSFIGDPAWEFCDEGWAETIRETGLDAYFQNRNIHTKEDREAFLRQIILYRPLQCLMWLYTHRHDEDPILFDTCVELIKKDLAEAKQIQ